MMLTSMPVPAARAAAPRPRSGTLRARLARVLCLLGALTLLSGCSLFGKDKDENETEGWTEEKIYYAAKDRMESNYFDGAIEFFEALQRQFPFGPYAQQAQLELAYCYYKTEEPASALGALDRFIKLYPTHPHMDYAYYLKGVTNFNVGKGLTQRYIPNDQSQRDPGASLRSFQDFAELIKRFPDSRYVADAQLRMVYLRNILARHEVNVANFYMRRGAYVAANNRARYVVENFQQAPAMPEALVLLAKTYKILELDELAADAVRVLETNYPNHPGISEVERTRVR